MKTRVGQLQCEYTTRGAEKWTLEVWHDGLGKHRLLRGPEKEIVLRKAELQAGQWEERWAATKDRERVLQDKEAVKREVEANKVLATERTAEAEQELEALGRLLHETLLVNDAVDWISLEDRRDFPEPRPLRPEPVPDPVLTVLPSEPRPDDKAYQPKFGLLDSLFSSRRQRITEECDARYKEDRESWHRELTTVEQRNAEVTRLHDSELNRQREIFEKTVAGWEARRAEFAAQQSRRNKAVERQRLAYESRTREAIIEYCDLVLSTSIYPDYFPQEFEVDYSAEGRLLVVEYTLPAPDAIPRLKAVKYVVARDEFTESFITDSQARSLYDSVLYQIALRTVHELFEADTVDALDGIVFNGIVTSVDRATGNAVTACILSLQVTKSEFLPIDLARVDPRACFKSLKGVGSSKLHSLAAVAPIMQMRRNDGRFVSAQEIAQTLDESSNLAAMDWEDFEHLIRELFEQEFRTSGGEVKVTQASRDGGVDAIAFDPDPIRGGKIVIQAKRYTNTVGVSAVRDLYGTVLNEGATKGVLVTTSDFGPDAYGFAKDKPLALLNGGNLLHMLEKHGHKVRIDIQEARRAAGRS